jgi:hypothetical protein
MAKETLIGILKEAEPVMDNFKRHKTWTMKGREGQSDLMFYMFRVVFAHNGEETQGVAKSKSESGNYSIGQEYSFTREVKDKDVWITGIKRTDAAPSANFGQSGGYSKQSSGGGGSKSYKAVNRYDDPIVQKDMTRTWSLKTSTTRFVKYYGEDGKNIENRDTIARFLYLFVHNKPYEDQNMVMKRKQAIEIVLDQIDEKLFPFRDFNEFKIEAERIFEIIAKPIIHDNPTLEPPASEREEYREPPREERSDFGRPSSASNAQDDLPF